MGRFVQGADLGQAIKHVVGGGNVRCAVAFWGGGSDALFTPQSISRPRIICDVSMGGTSVRALRDLGAPKNDDLRHVPGFHAKLYLSDRGAVVGSANASHNGIGFDAPPGLIEAGVALDVGDQAYTDAALWFETIWSLSKKVGKSALQIAAERFRPNRMPGAKRVRQGSLLDMIASDPDRFSEVSIVLAHTESTPKEREKARSAVAAAHRDREDEVNAMPASGMFMGWSRRDLNRWSRVFVELWMPDGKLHAYGRRASFFHDATGTVMSRVNWNALRDVLKLDLPSPSEIAEADGHIVRQLRAEHGNTVFRARELAAAIEALDCPGRPY